jgi:hypothetical protein
MLINQASHPSLLFFSVYSASLATLSPVERERVVNLVVFRVFVIWTFICHFLTNPCVDKRTDIQRKVANR